MFFTDGYTVDHAADIPQDEKRTMAPYPTELKEKLIARMMMPSPHNVKVPELARETGISESTLYTWRRKEGATATTVSVPGELSSEEKFGLGHPSDQHLDRRVSNGEFRPKDSATYGGTFAVSGQGGRNDDQGQKFNAELGTIRDRLLDITGRNRLLNLGKSGLVQFDTNSLDNRWASLLEEQELRIVPIPDPKTQELIRAGYMNQQEAVLRQHPSARDWKVHLEGQNRLPSPNKKEIRILMFPGELKKSLEGLQKKSKSSIDEKGANILFCVFGLLRWRDKDDERKAPLLALPVKLSATGKGDNKKFHLSYSGEKLTINLSLEKKLKADFGLTLPPPKFDSDGCQPESYLKELEAWLKQEEDTCSNWKVDPWTGLALLNFTKLRMYLDLDPYAWPEQQITNHPIVQQIFGCTPGQKVDQA